MSRHLRRVLLAACALAPSTAFASGDVGVVWTLLGAAIAWLVAGVCLAYFLIKRRTGFVRLGLFVLFGAALWYAFLHSSTNGFLMQSIGMMVAPALLLLGVRGRR